jgi:hypothetical protein
MGAGNDSSAVDVQARFQTARLDFTLASNTLNSETTAVADINITAGSSTARETNPVYVHMLNNAVAAGGPTNILRLRVSDLDASTNPLMFLEGFIEAGAGIDDDAVATWNAKGNTPTATASNVNVSLPGTPLRRALGRPWCRTTRCRKLRATSFVRGSWSKMNRTRPPQSGRVRR